MKNKTHLEHLRKRLRGTGSRLLLGVTGGIACGKTTVSNMLLELGAPLIDFDRIARQVVEPGTPGLKRIVDYFGKSVLRRDGKLDRKKMAGIVFGDTEKRKKLESFIHPPIYDEFVRRVDHIAGDSPAAIIQVAVPLLIEENLQLLFDRVVVVYLPIEIQVQRLTKRDRISTETALTIIGTQLPIDEKLKFADYVIHNDGSLYETRCQVEALLVTLKKIQRGKSG